VHRAASRRPKPPILIGAGVRRDGPRLRWDPERDTVLMIEKQINEAGGIDGRRVRFMLYERQRRAQCVMRRSG